MPTIYHRLRFLMVGTLRFAHPTDRELICFAHKRNLDTQLRPIGTTGKSVKPVQPSSKKYSASRATQINPITPRISPTKGALATSRTRGEMRWTRMALADVKCLTRTAKSCGSGAAVLALSPREAKLLAGDGGKKAVHRGEHEVSRNPSRRESRDASAGPVCSCARSHAQIAHETAGAACTRLSLRPLFSVEGGSYAKLGRISAARTRTHTLSLFDS